MRGGESNDTLKCLMDGLAVFFRFQSFRKMGLNTFFSQDLTHSLTFSVC